MKIQVKLTVDNLSSPWVLCGGGGVGWLIQDLGEVDMPANPSSPSFGTTAKIEVNYSK